MSEMKEKPTAHREVMTAIILSALVAVLCIVSCSAVLITLILNWPWR